MAKIIIFGAGTSGERAYKELLEKELHQNEIVAFADNYKTGYLFDLPIISAEDILQRDFDLIIIACCMVKEITTQLLDLGIPSTKIKESFTGIWIHARDLFVKSFAIECYRKGMRGNVAEAGVYRGEFAQVINENFPDKKLYLFDTFEGFDDRDLAEEQGWTASPEKGDFLKETSIDLVKSRLPHIENVIIKQGFVPDTFEGISDEFVFVNLDMDLYRPTKEALKWFYPRMVKGGVILVHDYFSAEVNGLFQNLKKGVIEFVEENHAISMPIGDEVSIAIIKQ